MCIRDRVNTIRLIKSELADPKLKKIGQKRAAGLVTAHSIPLLAAAASKLLLGVEDEEEEALRESAAPWDKNGTLIFFGKDSEGNRNYVNLSFTDPYSMFKKTWNAGALARDTDESVITSALGEFFDPLLSEDLLFERLGDVRSNKKKKDGRPIFNEQDDQQLQMIKKFAYLWEGVEPGFVNTITRFHDKATKGDAKDVGKEALALMTGMRLSTIKTKQNFPFHAIDFSKKKANVSKIFTTPAKFKDDITDEQLERKLNRMLDQREREYKKFNRRIQAALWLGMTEDEIRKSIKSTRSLNKFEREKMLAGEIPKFKLTKQFKKAVGAKSKERLAKIEDALKRRQQGIL